MSSSSDPWQVDIGDGGGQLLRCALAIAALAGRPAELLNIRAQRPSPGLRAQHLASARAVAAAAGGWLEGDSLGSRWLRFEPGDAAEPVDLTVDIGTAGSTMLVLQAVLPLLLKRGGHLRVIGGTDNPAAPPVDFVREVLQPALGELGLGFELWLGKRGYYPVGGGEVLATAEPQPRWPSFERVDWAGPARCWGIAYSSRLPLGVTERLKLTAERRLRKADGLTADGRAKLRAAEPTVEERPNEPAGSPGAGLVLVAEDAAGRRLAGSALGERGKPAEAVADDAAAMLLEELAAGAPCDRHLGDQLAVFAALADGPCAWRVSQVTDHLTSVLALLRDGLGREFAIDGTIISRG